MTLTNTMRELIAYVGNGTLYRHPGGFWTRNRDWTAHATTYGSSSIEALVSRGIAEYVDWQEGKRGRFPVSARLVPKVESA